MDYVQIEEEKEEGEPVEAHHIEPFTNKAFKNDNEG